MASEGLFGPGHSQRETDIFEYEPVERNLRGARNIQLGINIICAFLFILLFELIYGWQHFRPAASRKMFVENLARLALPDTVLMHKDISKLSPYAQWVVKIARLHCSRIVNPDSIYSLSSISVTQNPFLGCTKSNDLRDKLDSNLSRDSIWYQEEYLRLFVYDVDSLKKGLEKRLERQFDTIADSSRSIAYIDSLSLGEPFISFHLQEIKDRFQVNEETRQRRVSPRRYEVPVIGIQVQMEDLGIPIAVFLLILTYWLFRSLLNAYDSTLSYLLYLDGLKDLKKEDKEYKLRILINKYHFIDFDPKNPNSFQLRLGLIWLFLLPYLVVMAHLLANLHEATLLDFRYHGSDYFFNSSTLYAFNILMVPEFVVSLFLAVLGWLMISRFISTYREILGRSDYNKDKKEELIHKIKKHTTQIFVWILVTPFTLLGTFSALYFVGDLYKKDYFLTGMNLWIYFLIIIFFFVTTLVLFTIEVNTPKKWLAPIRFSFLPLTFKTVANNLKKWLVQLRYRPVPFTLTFILGLICMYFLLTHDLKSDFKFFPFPQPWFPGAVTLLWLFAAILYLRWLRRSE